MKIFFIWSLIVAGLATIVYALIAAHNGRPEDLRPAIEQEYNVTFLFEKDGVKVYYFHAQGNDVYFTTRGDVTAHHTEYRNKQAVDVKVETRTGE